MQLPHSRPLLLRCIIVARTTNPALHKRGREEERGTYSMPYSMVPSCFQNFYSYERGRNEGEHFLSKANNKIKNEIDVTTIPDAEWANVCLPPRCVHSTTVRTPCIKYQIPDILKSVTSDGHFCPLLLFILPFASARRRD